MPAGTTRTASALPRHAARIARPHPAAAAAGLGFAGGALAGLAAQLALVAGSIALAPGALAALRRLDHEAIRAAALTPVNAVGAWLVRWLQVADPTALHQPYADATLGGVLTAVVLGALGGALVAVAGERFPEDAPLAWCLAASLLAWAAARAALVPALDPLLLRVVDGRLLLAAFAVYGAVLAAWTSAARRAAAADRA